jgi:hypothetical protein
MRLSVIETDDEHMCLSKILTSKHLFSHLAHCQQQPVVSEPYGQGFAAWWWSGGSDVAEEGNYKWCYPDRAINMTMSSIIKWNAGQPDNAGKNEHCVNFIIQGGVPPTNMVYSDYTCSTELKFICEVFWSKIICVLIV